MRKWFRNAMVGIFLSPLIAYAHVVSVMIGRDKAAMAVGRTLTRADKRSHKFGVPEIASAEDFDKFAPKMKARFPLWKPLYDIEVLEET